MKVKDFFKGLLALCFLIVLVLLGWAMFTSMVKVFGEYTSAIEPTIVVAIVSGLGAIIVNAIAKVSERKNQAFTITKEKMTAVYESFLTELDGTPTAEDASVFAKYQSLFAVNASDDTYQEFLVLKDSENKDPSRLIVSMRNELKISNKKNKKQDTKA